MPLYTFRCEKCQHRRDKIVKIADKDTPLSCDACSGVDTMKYEPFTAGEKGSNLYFKGKFFANTKGY